MRNTYTLPIDAVLLLGPTGAGKSPLGEAIEQRGLFGRKCLHLDFGAELRSAVSGGKGSAAYSPEELDFIHGVLERGLLLENEHFPLAKKIITIFLEQKGFTQRDLLILNGIPRHLAQAQDIEEIARVHSLIVLDCNAEEVFCRLRNNAGKDRAERIDDGPKLVEKKLKIFRERTAPLVAYYQQQGSSICNIEVSG
ncbi:MAG TPA: nucleoside monophosphate kinase, partial [Nitrospirota bacterium]|nr:nucleoside monophosphate kinase [Nitrospirota bacterium]